MGRDALLGWRSGRNWAELDAAGPTLEGEVEPQITQTNFSMWSGVTDYPNRMDHK